MREVSRKEYYVYSEGYSFSCYETGGNKYGGSITMVEVMAHYEVHPPEEGEDEEYWELQSYDIEDYIDDAYIEDKWGGKTIINIPETVEPEFTNGLIEVYFGEDIIEASNAYDEYVHEGEIDWSELETW